MNEREREKLTEERDRLTNKMDHVTMTVDLTKRSNRQHADLMFGEARKRVIDIQRQLDKK
jgi:hypothetical protein